MKYGIVEYQDIPPSEGWYKEHVPIGSHTFVQCDVKGIYEDKNEGYCDLKKVIAYNPTVNYGLVKLHESDP